MNLSFKTLLCGIIALNAFAFAEEDFAEEEEECYTQEWTCPCQYVFRFVPYYPEGDALRGQREESRWPGKRNFELFDRLTQ